MKIARLFTLLGLVALLAGCASAYKMPEDKEPHALLKLKFKYASVVPGSSLGARMHIRHGATSESGGYQVAFNKTYGAAGGRVSPEIPIAAVKVHPGKKTDVTMAVYFFWYTTHTYTVMVNRMPQVQTRQVYNERACTMQVSFTPTAGKIYLLDYSSPNVDKDCNANAYEQVMQPGGQFKLNKVGTSKSI